MLDHMIELRLKTTGAQVRQHGPYTKADAKAKAAEAPPRITNLYTVHVLPAPATMLQENCPNCAAAMINITSMDRQTLVKRVCRCCGWDTAAGKVVKDKKTPTGARGETWGT